MSLRGDYIHLNQDLLDKLICIPLVELCFLYEKLIKSKPRIAMLNAKETYEAFQKSMLHKSDHWKTLIADDIHLIAPLAEVKGKAAFIELNEPFFASILTNKVHKVSTQGNFVTTRISTTVALPSGESLTLEVSEWYEIKDGLIQSLWTYFDTYEFRKAMNM